MYTLSNRGSRNYRRVTIDKKDGGSRTLLVPCGLLKGVQRNILHHVLDERPVSPCAQAYRKGTDIRGNASCHLGKKLVLKLDISHFFDSILFPRVYGAAFPETLFPPAAAMLLTSLCCCNERLPLSLIHISEAWVINYTNPMTVCVKTLYRTFPEIKAFGCCHEVFGTQKLLGKALEDILQIKDAQREDIRVNVVGVNHFTWLTSAQYKNIDLFPVYREFALKYKDTGFGEKTDENWMNKFFDSLEMVKLDLFLKYGAIAAAGDRHLAEFCPGSWYLKNPDTAHSWGFKLTPVAWRKEDLKKRLARSERLYKGEEEMVINTTGEEGVQQMRSLLGLRDLVTNVNIPNYGQIPNLPLGAVVETNAHFCADSVLSLIHICDKDEGSGSQGSGKR